MIIDGDDGDDCVGDDDDYYVDDGDAMTTLMTKKMTKDKIKR